MAVIKIKEHELELRAANPEQDLPYAYGLFKRLTESFVESLAGKWPEQEQYDFFRKGFSNPNVQIITQNKKPIGCFGIIEEFNRVSVQRMYVEAAWQGTGLGRWIIGQALEKARDAKKPLEAEVLTTNNPAIGFYNHIGFRVVGDYNYGWVKQHAIRHKDTELYVPACLPTAKLER